MPSLPSLLRKMKKHRSPKKLSMKELELRGLEVVASVGVKQLTFRSAIKGTTGNIYRTSIRFNNVEFFKEPTKKATLTAVISSKTGKGIVYFAPVNIKRHNVMVVCKCPDSRFTWEKEDADVKALIGNWRRYTRVTPPSGRPERNPTHSPGICKHIMYLLKMLKRQDYIKE